MFGDGNERRLPPQAADLRLEREAHRRALRDFISMAEAIPPADWNAPVREEKWSPAQVTEHLRLSYAAVRAELAGQGGLRIRTKWWQQRLFRLLYLPRILKSGRFPRGVPAIREIRPASGPFDRQQLLAAFRDEGERFLDAVGAAHTDTAAISHPFLGRLTLVEGVRFMTRHVRHHQAQIVPADHGPEVGGQSDRLEPAGGSSS
jgi:hypothetical protein